MNIKNDFPFLTKNPKLIYLDNACTSIKPQQVIDSEISYYVDFAACGGRSSHSFGRRTSEKIEECREFILDFVSAKGNHLIWVKNTTEGLNQVIKGFDYSKRKKVVTSSLEHHAVLLPLMKLKEQGIIDLEIISPTAFGQIPIESWIAAIDKKTALVVTSCVDNVIGHRKDLSKISKIAHENGALICVDGAQGVPHYRTTFNADKLDFLCFSAHKMLGPSGIGALVARSNLIDTISPLVTGGGTVKTVTLDNVAYVSGHERFEAGIQNYGGIFGFATACTYLNKLGMEKIEQHEQRLGKAMLTSLKSVQAELYGPANSDKISSLYAFNFKNAKPHEIALLLDKENIAVRSGFFCAQPAMERIGAKNGAVRASTYIYNSEEDIKKFGEILIKLNSIYG